MRIATFGVVLLSSSLLLFTATTQRANALLFLDPFESVVIAALETMETLILGLSNDIGSMAGEIGIMADRIGDMADRIVHTEELMVAASSNNVITSLITSPVEGTLVYKTIPIQITLSSEKTNYLLFISNNADMSGSTNALVLNGDTSIAWSRVPDFATGTKLYIAVKTVDDNGSSDFSNTVMLNL